MDKSLFFDFNKWEDYLSSDFSLVVSSESSRRNKKKVYITEPMEHSFQISFFDLVESYSFSKGVYNKNNVQGIYEEFRLRIKNPKHFEEKHPIPCGKYRIRVAQEFDETPVVSTFIRKFGRWKQQKLSENIPLTEMLKKRDFIFE